MKVKALAVAAVLLGTMVAAIACSQSAPSASGSLKVYVTDAPPSRGVTAIMVTVSAVQVHRAAAAQTGNQTVQTVSSNQTEPPEPVGGEWISVNLSDSARTFNLLDVKGIEQYLGAREIPAAKYTQVRLSVEKVQVEFDNSGNYQDAQVPSGTLRIAHPFDIIAGKTTALVIDFNADKMVTVTGQGDVIVKPVVKLTTRQERQPGQPLTIEDTSWLLQSYGQTGNMTQAIAGRDVTAKFDSTTRQVTGSAGCNSYFGGYTLDGSQLTIGPVGSTEMACLDPAGIMDQEQAYLKILGKAESYQINGQTLTISGSGGQLVFKAQ